MARIKYSGLIESINGSIGGTTFQNNRYGFTVKRKPVNTKPNTPQQNFRKSAMFTVQQNWIALTDAQRAAWNTYASTFPRATRLNPDANLNGFNYFCAYHLLRFSASQNVLPDPYGAQQTLSYNYNDIYFSPGVLTWELDFTISGGGWWNLLYLSRPISITNQARKNRLRFVKAYFASTDFATSIGTPYIKIFGAVPVTGDFLFAQTVSLNALNGQIFKTNIDRVQVFTVP